MRIIKNGVVYQTRTTREFDNRFVSIVTRRVGDSEKLIHREVHTNRSKAYKRAVFVCKAQ